jgi:hypothetical protein
LYDKNKEKLIAFPAGKMDTAFTIPGSVKSIEDSAFYYCKNLKDVSIIPDTDTVTGIGYGAFAGCSSLTTVTIGIGVNRIRDYAFSDCTSLTSVTFKDTIDSRDFSSYTPFPGDLRAAFYEPPNTTTGNPGTYIRDNGSTDWTKQP